MTAMKTRDKEAVRYARSLEARLIEVTPWINSSKVAPPCGLFIEASWSNGEAGWIRSDICIKHFDVAKAKQTVIDHNGVKRPVPDFWRLQQDVPSY